MDGLQRTSFTLRDTDAAEEALAAYFPTLRLGGAGRSSFEMSFSAAIGRGFSLVEYSFDGPGAAFAGSEDLVIATPTGSGYRLEHGREPLRTGHPFVSPADGLVARWETHDASLVTLDFAVVEHIARIASGDDDFELRRTGAAAVSRELEDYWSVLTRSIRGTIAAAPEAFTAPLIEQSIVHQLATGFLHAFPTNWLDLRDARPPGSAVVRRAIEFMHAHAGEPITMTDVAGAVFISTRGLHAAFTRELDDTPAQYLRRIRLDGARADLVVAAPEATVAAVAHRWGFAHLPRFAEGYRREFGENPSETLRR